MGMPTAPACHQAQGSQQQRGAVTSRKGRAAPSPHPLLTAPAGGNWGGWRGVRCPQPLWFCPPSPSRLRAFSVSLCSPLGFVLTKPSYGALKSASAFDIRTPVQSHCKPSRVERPSLTDYHPVSGTADPSSCQPCCCAQELLQHCTDSSAARE